VTASVKRIGYAAAGWKKGIDLRMNSKKIPMLSKSKYLAGLQCLLRLWHQCYNPDLAPPVPPAKQALFDTGHEVGRSWPPAFTRRAFWWRLIRDATKQAVTARR
jgi:hypothetical protein